MGSSDFSDKSKDNIVEWSEINKCLEKKEVFNSTCTIKIARYGWSSVKLRESYILLMTSYISTCIKVSY